MQAARVPYICQERVTAMILYASVRVADGVVWKSPGIRCKKELREWQTTETLRRIGHQKVCSLQNCACVDMPILLPQTCGPKENKGKVPQGKDIKVGTSEYHNNMNNGATAYVSSGKGS